MSFELFHDYSERPPGFGYIDWSRVTGGASGSSTRPGASGSSSVPGGASAGYDPFARVTGGASGENDPWAGVTAGVEGSAANRSGGLFRLQDYLNPFNPLAVALAPAELISAAVELVIRGQDVDGAARKLVEEHGGVIGEIALALGIGMTAATALVIAGGGVVLLVVLKLK